MELKKMNVDGREVEFVNQSTGTRNGFKHVSTCFVDGVEIGTHTSHYLNRTWECYPFQTSMRGVINDKLETHIESLKYKFKYNNNYKNMTPKRNEEFQKIIDTDEQIIFYRKVKEMLK